MLNLRKNSRALPHSGLRPRKKKFASAAPARGACLLEKTNRERYRRGGRRPRKKNRERYPRQVACLLGFLSRALLQRGPTVRESYRGTARRGGSAMGKVSRSSCHNAYAAYACTCDTCHMCLHSPHRVLGICRVKTMSQTSSGSRRRNERYQPSEK